MNDNLLNLQTFNIAEYCILFLRSTPIFSGGCLDIASWLQLNFSHRAGGREPAGAPRIAGCPWIGQPGAALTAWLSGLERQRWDQRFSTSH